MKIVYTSNAGHTAAYASLLGGKLNCPVYSLQEAHGKLQAGEEIIYLGWLFANTVKGYKKAAGKYRIAAVCAVGLCDTGTALDDVRRVNKIPEEIALFTMQGGMNKAELRGINRFMIRMLIKMIEKKQDKTEDDRRMLYLLHNDQNYVSEENTAAFMAWYAETRS